jgi:hypothetical protein
VNETPTPANTTTEPSGNTQPKPAPIIDRKLVTQILATLVCERYGHVYGAKPSKEVEDAFVQWINESEYGKSLDTAALQNDIANLIRFKSQDPAEWARRKPWLNRPTKGPRLLKALVQVTREAARHKPIAPPKPEKLANVLSCPEHGDVVTVPVSPEPGQPTQEPDQ